MSKHEKTLRRTRRKTDAARRQRARSRAFRIPQSAIRNGAAVLAAAAAIAAGTSAYADQVRFDNLSQGAPGRFDWNEVDPAQGRRWLDVTLDLLSQPPADGAPGGFGPGVFGQERPENADYGFVIAKSPGDLQTGGYLDRNLVGVGTGVPIPSGTAWKEWGYTCYYGCETPEGVPTYLGVRFDLGGGYQYGWIGVVRTGTRFDTFAWGYETEPGVPIPAGAGSPPDTGCSDDADCDDGVFCNGAEVCDPENEGAGDDGCVAAAAACAEDQICDEDAAQCISVASLIIKQGACPAPVNTSGNGVVPMVLAGDSGFAASTAVPESIELRRCDGTGGAATPLANHTKLKDLNHPADANVACGECACNDDQSSDGITDLSLKFATNDLVAAGLIGPGDGQVTLELTGELADGTLFVARDCVAVLGSGEVQQTNANVESNEIGAYIEMAPLDLNADSDGFANFGRAYVLGTQVTLTAPIVADGRRFLRWMVDGQLQAFGIRTIEVTISEDLALKAFYQRPTRVTPDRPSEGSGDME